MDIVIVTGLSGAGKSRVAAVLEDLGFYCVDNMPVSMMPKFAELCVASGGRYERVALVTDVRALMNVNDLYDALEEMRALGCSCMILFVEAEVDTIVKRYKETRRRHPLGDTGRGLEDVVKQEIDTLAPLRIRADEVIDTTGLTLGSLQNRLSERFMKGPKQKAISINIKSFGYKYGLPIDSDLVFDVRFMPNPFYVEGLQNKTGLDSDVRDFVFGYEQSNEFFKRLCDLMDFLLPHYIEEGKRYLVVCIGCTGGKHRSVAIAHALSARMTNSGYLVNCTHRDIERT